MRAKILARTVDLWTALALVGIIVLIGAPSYLKAQAMADKSINTRIAELVEHVASIDHAPPAPEEYEAISRALQDLVAAVDGDSAAAAVALLDFQSRHMHDERKIGASVFLLHQLAPTIPKERAITAFGPGLADRDSDIRQNYEEVLDLVLRDCAVDFAPIGAVLATAPDQVDDGVVRYMIARSPEQAILLLTNHYSKDQQERRDVLLAFRIIDTYAWKQMKGLAAAPPVAEDIAAASLLANHRLWWARLYIAEMLRAYPGLRDQEVIKKLRADEHELVRQKVAEFTN